MHECSRSTFQPKRVLVASLPMVLELSFQHTAAYDTNTSVMLQIACNGAFILNGAEVPAVQAKSSTGSLKTLSATASAQAVSNSSEDFHLEVAQQL